ncbi:hypothetical protein BJY01DRAFT_238068 [Aspergillus pseudoustus]|uniref:NAD-dependent epimerase/dehydratase domain-containing protein n=1 Tax=Aspergillus pseudoustus TaxID=1810923 RepID=A0ABR4JA59_9EURO
MPKMLILGATGYLGLRIANTFVQSGPHTIYGVARSTAGKATLLARNEISPVICLNPGSAAILESVIAVGRERQAEYERSGVKGPRPKLGFLYCSGSWPVKIPLDPSSHPGLLHVDDAASALLCAVNKLASISGTGVYPVFDLVSSKESMRDIFEAMAECWGFKAFNPTFRGSSVRAKQVLGWSPARDEGLVAGMGVYAKAFEAWWGFSK